MHVHILGICGTFMGGIAALARAAGHQVSGSDDGVFPPMSTQLASLGIELDDGYNIAALSPEPDIVVVGNVMSRGMPVIEHLLNSGISYTSGPQWLADNVLAQRHVLAVAGTHGKTSTASMLAWILQYAGLNPGFLIGGVPVDFGVSAQLGAGKYFVVEADEYDTAFFDKRSKFVHYSPETLVLTNLEFDHADIFDDMAAIRKQFHHLLRTVPAKGQLVVHGDSKELDKVLRMGCWTPVQRYGTADSDWYSEADGERLSVRFGDIDVSDSFTWPGEHNHHNAVAACAAAMSVGVAPAVSLAALARWQGVRRRLEEVGRRGDIVIYDDFAHHPTEIVATLQALASTLSEDQRLVAVFEPRSNSMRAGVHSDRLAQAFSDADAIFVLQPADLGWDIAPFFQKVGRDVSVAENADQLLTKILDTVQAGDRVAFMSNGSFDQLPTRLLQAL